MKETKIEITNEKLDELISKTNDKFVKYLINDLKMKLNNSDCKYSYLDLEFYRIKKIIEREANRNQLDGFNKKDFRNISYELIVKSRTGKKRKLLFNGETLLSKISSEIQGEFDLEPMHLYEFEIGGHKFGPECDEWQEIFDSLDSFKFGAAISAANIGKGDKFKFLYDFGDRIRFIIEIGDILRLEKNKNDK